MARLNNFETAKLVQILFWFDGPQIVLLQKTSVEFIIGVEAGIGNSDFGFVGASITRRQLGEYQSEKFDLRYLFTRPDLRRWYAFNFNHEFADFRISRVKKGSDIVIRSVPETGLFARSHDAIDLISNVAPNATETFDIDGSWDLNEFSKFYGQVEDIYSMFVTIDKFSDVSLNTDQRTKISDAFVRPWAGGGSYRGFYDRIANDNDYDQPLRVSGIKYNSPGYVELKARQAPFDHMIELLRSFASQKEAARTNYNILYRYLSLNGLLRAPDNATLTDSVREGIEIFARQVSASMVGVNYDSIFVMARNNILVTAKVLLSIYRRTEKLFNFFEQGRVHYDGLDIDPMVNMLQDTTVD